MNRYEYATTHGALYRAAYYDRNLACDVDEEGPDDPIRPDGDGWEFVNGTASGHRLYFFWKRKVSR